MTLNKPRRIALGVATALAAATVVTLATSGEDAPAGDEASARSQTVVEVQSRQFRSVVTLDAAVARATASPVRAGLTTDAVTWSVADGEQVSAGQELGSLSTSMDATAADQASIERQIQLLDEQHRVAVKLADLDIAAAKRNLAAAKSAASSPQPDAASAGDPRSSASGSGSASASGSADAEDALVRAQLAKEQLGIQHDSEKASLQQQVAAARAEPDLDRRVTSPTAGRLVLAGDEPMVQPDGYVVTASVPPILLYRLTNDSTGTPSPTPPESEVQVTNGPLFPCAGLRFSDENSPAVAPQPAAAQEASEGSARATCDVPGDVQVFAGLDGTLAITVVNVPSATVVDAAAVRVVTPSEGLVSVISADGTTSQREIKVGANDGLSLIVLEGLDVGERVVIAEEPG